MSKKRPWKNFARIERVELNNGDVKFMAFATPHRDESGGAHAFESLDAAEADLDAWWAVWWPVQVKSRRPA